MNNRSIDLTGKLPKGLVELYSTILTCASQQEIELLVVGATARDLVLVHGYGANITRGTRDIDFGINIADWEQFDQLAKALVSVGFEQHQAITHKFHYTDQDQLPWEIDIVPFGPITDNNHEISWPPDHSIKMSTFGFQEAYDHALSVQINDTPNTTLPVASPAGITLLKLIAWVDRLPEGRPKDATDLIYIIQNYATIPEVLHELYEHGYMEAHDWDEPKASAMKLGKDIQTIATSKSIEHLSIQLFKHKRNSDRFAQHLKTNRDTTENADQLYYIFRTSFTKKIY